MCRVISAAAVSPSCFCLSGPVVSYNPIKLESRWIHSTLHHPCVFEAQTSSPAHSSSITAMFCRTHHRYAHYCFLIILRLVRRVRRLWSARPSNGEAHGRRWHGGLQGTFPRDSARPHALLRVHTVALPTANQVPSVHVGGNTAVRGF